MYLKKLNNFVQKSIILPLIFLIKFYKYLISPFLLSSCRYQPTCSEYFIETLKKNGLALGIFLGLKRILSCHPIKVLGGKEGFDPAYKFKKRKN